MDLLERLNADGLVKDNQTHLILSIPLTNARNVTAFGKPGDEYDADGAMVFIVATVSMYSLGIVAFVAGHIFRKSNNLSTDRQTNVYISTFNRNHLNNLSKLHMLRCMQRKMLARYNMLETKKNRNVKVKYVSCNRDDCHRNTNMDGVPRIFQDVVSKRYISSETDSLGKCSLSAGDVSNCSLTDVSLDVSVTSDDVYICRPISREYSNGSSFDWCTADEEAEISSEVDSSSAYDKDNEQMEAIEIEKNEENDHIKNDNINKHEDMNHFNNHDIMQDNDLQDNKLVKKDLINDKTVHNNVNNESEIENNDKRY